MALCGFLMRESRRIAEMAAEDSEYLLLLSDIPFAKDTSLDGPVNDLLLRGLPGSTAALSR
jgi:hypothetical protein